MADREDLVIVNRLLAAVERVDFATGMGVLTTALVARAVGEGMPCDVVVELVERCFAQREAQVARRATVAS